MGLLSTCLLLLLIFTTASNAKNDETLYQIPIEDREDSLYLIQLQMGTPPQNFTVQLDTGSADAWVIDSNCDSLQCRGRAGQKHRFNKSSSRTFAEDGHEFLIEYNHRGVEGKIGKDKMQIGDILVREQSFGVATLLDQEFGQIPIDGIFGIGLEKLSQTGVKSPLQNILQQLSDSSFTIWLGSHASGKTPGGTLTFGGVDSKNCESSWTYLDITQSGYWGFKVSGFQFAEYAAGRSSEAIIDSRDNYISAPTSIFKAIVQKLGATQIDQYDFYGIPCDKINSASDLVFKIGGLEFRVSPQEYVRKLKGIKNDKCVVFVADSSMKGFDNKWVFGDPFMRTACTNYSTKFRQVGLAVAKKSK